MFLVLNCSICWNFSANLFLLLRAFNTRLRLLMCVEITLNDCVSVASLSNAWEPYVCLINTKQFPIRWQMTDHPTAQLFSDFKLHCGEASSAYISGSASVKTKLLTHCCPRHLLSALLEVSKSNSCSSYWCKDRIIGVFYFFVFMSLERLLYSFLWQWWLIMKAFIYYRLSLSLIRRQPKRFMKRTRT